MKIKVMLIIILGLILRLVNLNQSFWLDETAQAVMSSKPLSYIWFERGGDFQPPLFYILAHFWLQFDRSEVWLRLLPVAFGVLAIWAIYRFSNDSLAAFFLAINPFHIYYSQEFRMYSLVVLLAILSMQALIKNNRWFWLWTTLLLYTHYTTVFLLFAQLIYVVVFAKEKIRFIVISFLVSAILYLPWYPQLFNQLNSAKQINSILPGWSELLSVGPIKAIPQTLFKLAAGQINLYPKIWYGVYITSVLLTLGLVFILARGARSLLWIWIWIPILLMIVTSFFLPMTQPFRLIYILPGLLLLAANAAKRFPKLISTLIIYIAVVGNIMYFTRPRLQREQWRQAIGFLQKQNADIMVRFSDKWAPFYWYAPEMNIVKVPTQNKVFLVDYLGELTDPQQKVKANLQTLGYKEMQTYNFEGVGFVREYLKL